MKNFIVILAVAGAVWFWYQHEMNSAVTTAVAASAEMTEHFNKTTDRVSAKAEIKRLEQSIPLLRENVRRARTPGEATLAQTDLETAMRQLEEAEKRLEASRQ